MYQPLEILKQYWNYDHFRPGQLEIIESVLSGKDTLALLPTGGGKSICFQVPAMVKTGVCLVVSPLIALMKDQVEHLHEKGISAISIQSGMNFYEVKKALEAAVEGQIKFLYVSPERLHTSLFEEFLPYLKLNMIAVDEAHCISQWGYDFRPSYLHIAAVRKKYPHIPILAVSASATDEVQKDISEKLHFRSGFQILRQSFARPNLSYSVFDISTKQSKLIQIIRNVPGSGIVYCKSRKRTRELAELLQLNGISADFYHAGLSNEQRSQKQENWIENKIRIICCTNAFGMGIDKPDVRLVVHVDTPDALEHYYQEAGRAGRDGKKSYAVLFYNEQEIEELQSITEVKFPPREMIRKVYGALCNYFQLASGCGEGMTFDFDMSVFVKNFKLDAFVVNSVLKILEQEEWLNFNDQFFAPSTLVFTTNREELEEVEKNYPQMDKVIKGILRSYDGVFDYPASINENHIAKFTRTEKKSLLAMLHRMHRMGLIEYHPQKEQPQIRFQYNRVAADDLRVNEKNIKFRKRAYEKRLKAMLHYTRNTVQCRSVMIGAYFSDHDLKPCGICDTCLRLKKTEVSKLEFAEITSLIQKALLPKPLPVEDLIVSLPGVPKIKIWKVMSFLHTEGKITSNTEGIVKWVK